MNTNMDNSEFITRKFTERVSTTTSLILIASGSLIAVCKIAQDNCSNFSRFEYLPSSDGKLVYLYGERI
jgi:hypothetical protein